MARIMTMGAESGAFAAEANSSVDGTSTSQAYSGSRSFNGTTIDATFTGGVTGRTYFARCRFKKTSNPGSTFAVFGIYSGATSLAVISCTTSGTLTFNAPGATNRFTSAALNDNQWYTLEISININAAAGADDSVEFRLDGVVVYTATASATVGTLAPTLVKGGSGGPTLYTDEIILNDDQGSDENTYPNLYSRLAFLIPVSTNQAGSWTGGAGGAAVFGAVDNVPPTGHSTETDSTQIESVDTTGDNATDEFRVNLTTYTNAGISESDTILVLQPTICHGEDVATNTKTGSFGLQSNPSQTYSPFTFGSDIGALGIFPSNWRGSQGNPVYLPSVTLGSSPVLAVRKTDSGTRVASVAQMGMYVEYLPYMQPEKVLRLVGDYQPHIHRASRW